MVLTIRVLVPKVTRRVMASIGWIILPDKPFNSVGESLNFLASIPMLVNAFQNSMSTELPLSIASA